MVFKDVIRFWMSKLLTKSPHLIIEPWELISTTDYHLITMKIPCTSIPLALKIRVWCIASCKGPQLLVSFWIDRSDIRISFATNKSPGMCVPVILMHALVGICCFFLGLEGWMVMINMAPDQMIVLYKFCIIVSDLEGGEHFSPYLPRRWFFSSSIYGSSGS